MPGVVEPTEKQTLSNVVILKLVYTMYIQRAAARSFCFFKDKQHRSLSKIFRGNRNEGEKLEYDVKKKIIEHLSLMILTKYFQFWSSIIRGLG